MAAIYHPETQATIMVPDESLSHYRQSGWVTVDEWAENLRLREVLEARGRAVMQAAEDAAEDAPVKQPRKAPDKETK